MLKKRIAVFISVFILLSQGISTFAAKSVSELNNEKADIKREKQETEADLKATQNKQKEAKAKIDNLNSQVEEVNNELNKINTKLAEVENRLEVTQKELKEAEEKSQRQYESLKSRLRVMYENGKTGYLQIIMEAESLTDLIKRIEYVNRIMDYDNSILLEYKKNQDYIAEKVKLIEEDKIELEVLKNQQETKKEELDGKISEVQVLLNQLKADESTYQTALDELEQRDKEVSRLISQATSVKATSKSANKVYSGLTGGTLAYPVPQYAGYRTNSGYGYRGSPISGKGEFHTGLDLKATLNCDIVAAEDGTVTTAGWVRGYGNTVIINHGNGLSTLYGHNNSLVVSVGQSVKRGQVIAKAGSTGYSTGVHCHFEVRVNGKHTSPVSYLQ